MAKTIKELSVICGVSEQAIRGWCRKNNVAKDAKGKAFAITESIEMAILVHYGAVAPKDAKGKERNHESSNETKFMLEILQKELDFCKSQLAEKDEQINRLQIALETSQQSLNQAQQLQALAEQKILLLEDSTKKKKKHWWSRAPKTDEHEKGSSE